MIRYACHKLMTLVGTGFAIFASCTSALAQELHIPGVSTPRSQNRHNVLSGSRLGHRPLVSIGSGKIWYSEGPDPLGANGWTLTQVRQINSSGSGDQNLADVSPNLHTAKPNPAVPGEWIFTYITNNQTGIFRTSGSLPKSDADLSSAKVIVPTQDIVGVCIDPSNDGKTLYYTAISASGGIGHLCSIPMTGGTPKVLDNSAYGMLQVNPSGTKIAYAELNLNLLTAYLYVCDIDGSNKKCLTPNATYAASFGVPAWNHSGTKLTCIRYDGSTGLNSDLFAVNPDGSGLANLTNTANSDEAIAAYSPDDTQIVFSQTSNSTGDSNLMLAKADGTNAKILHTAAAGEYIGLIYWPSSPTQAVSLASLTLDPTTVVGGGTSTGTVTLNGKAPSGGALVSLQSDSSAASVGASVTIPAGGSSATFTVSTANSQADQSAHISASYSGKSVTAALTIKGQSIVGLSVSPSSVASGSSSPITGHVDLSSPAPNSGVKVNLSSNSSSITVPASVTVPSGQTGANFSVTAKKVTAETNATITGTWNSSSASTNIRIFVSTIKALKLSSTSVTGGNSVTATITLNGAAGSSGQTVSLVTADPSSTSVPDSIVVPAGANTVSFTVNTTGVSSDHSATITASTGSVSQKTVLTVKAPTLSSVSLNPTSVIGGSASTVTGTVTLTGKAPAGGLLVNLKSSSASAAKTPANVTIPAGSTAGTFSVTHSKVKATVSATITASKGTLSKTATLKVTKG